MNLIILISFAFSLSCEKPEGSSIDTLPQLVWRVPLGPSPSDQKSQNPYIYKNKLIMGYQLSDGNEGYYVYDKNTGKVLKDIPNQASFDATSVGIDNLYFSKGGVNLRTINMDDFTLNVSKFPILSRVMPQLSVKDEMIFMPRLSESPNENIYDFAMCDLKKGLNISIINEGSFTKDSSTFRTGGNSIAFQKNLKNEEVMYMPIVSIYYSVLKKSRYKVEAYNLSKLKSEWTTLELTLPGVDNHLVCPFDPIINGDLIIIGLGGTHLYAFNKYNGTLVWQKELGNLGRNIIELNGKITVISNIGKMTQIDAKTGAILRESNIGFAELFNISLHKGIMYFATVTNKLMAIDATTHEKLWEMPPLNKCGYCTYGYAYTIVDAETNRLFVSDKKEVVCFLLK